MGYSPGILKEGDRGAKWLREISMYDKPITEAPHIVTVFFPFWGGGPAGLGEYFSMKFLQGLFPSIAHKYFLQMRLFCLL